MVQHLLLQPLPPVPLRQLLVLQVWPPVALQPDRLRLK